MIEVRNKETGELLGLISDEELQFLIDQLEEESDTDTDYYLNRTSVDNLKQDGASAHLSELLERALGDGDEAEIVWSRS